MLRPEQLQQLPPNVSDFIRQEPGRRGEITQALSEYRGRLGFVRDLKPGPILDYQGYLMRAIPKEEREEGIARISEKLAAEFAVSRRDLDPRVIFRMAPSNSTTGLDFVNLPLEEVARYYWEKEQIVRAFNHPFRTQLRELYEDDLRRRFPNREMDKLPPMNSPAIEHLERTGELAAFDEFAVAIPPGKKQSRQLAQAIGSMSVLGPHHVGLPVGSETMPDVVGDAQALAAIVQCHAMAAAPRNNIFSDATVQGRLLHDTQILLEESPVLQGREDGKLVLSQWDRNLGILVEPNAFKACTRIQKVLKELRPGRSIGYVRIYMVEGSNEALETAQIIKKYWPDLEVHFGQVVTEDQAKEAQDTDVDGLGIGVTSGSRCSTAARSGIPPQNINFLYNIRKNGSRLPIFTESGVPHHAMPVALAAGVSRVNYSAGVLGWLDAPGHQYGWDNKKGQVLHVYDGEAGPRAKQVEDRVYAWGMPVMLEGVNGWNPLDRQYSTIPHRLWYLQEGLVLTNTFHRELFHEDLIYNQDVVIQRMTPALAGQVHPFEHF